MVWQNVLLNYPDF
uniref:Uncharacterized protein n=1 Tax=Rhizophora mucronata TaxID=61149 RepID=A0A2P2QFJ3_RHIMU